MMDCDGCWLFGGVARGGGGGRLVGGGTTRVCLCGVWVVMLDVVGGWGVDWAVTRIEFVGRYRLLLDAIDQNYYLENARQRSDSAYQDQPDVGEVGLAFL